MIFLKQLCTCIKSFACPRQSQLNKLNDGTIFFLSYRFLSRLRFFTILKRLVLFIVFCNCSRLRVSASKLYQAVLYLALTQMVLKQNIPVSTCLRRYLITKRYNIPASFRMYLGYELWTLFCTLFVKCVFAQPYFLQTFLLHQLKLIVYWFWEIFFEAKLRFFSSWQKWNIL